VVNLQKKLEIIDQMDKLAGSKDKDPRELKALQDEWKGIGFVPKNELKSINDKYNQVIEKYIGGLEALNEDEKDSLKMAHQLAIIKGSPMADKKLHRKESEIFKRISNLRKEIDRYNNNIEFSSRSSKADKLREEIHSKIQEAETELKTLEDQLKLIKES
jgi:hypothetical protein